MNKNKFIAFGMLLVLVLQVGFVVGEETSEITDVGELLGLEDKIYGENIDYQLLEQEGGINVFFRNEDSKLIDRHGNVFDGIDFEKFNYIKLDVKGNVIEADFIIAGDSEELEYVFGENKPLKNLAKETNIYYREQFVSIKSNKDESFFYGDNLITITKSPPEGFSSKKQLKAWQKFHENSPDIMINEMEINCPTGCTIDGGLLLAGKLNLEEEGYLINYRGTSVRKNGFDFSGNRGLFIYNSPINFSNSYDKINSGYVYASKDIFQAYAQGNMDISFDKENKFFDLNEESMMRWYLHEGHFVEVSLEENKLSSLGGNFLKTIVNHKSDANSKEAFAIDNGIFSLKLGGEYGAIVTVHKSSSKTIPFKMYSNELAEGFAFSFDSNNNYEVYDENLIRDTIKFNQPKKIVMDPSENYGKNAIVIVADPKSDWNGAFEFGNEEINKIRNAGFTNVVVDTVSTKQEYFKAFKKGVESLDGGKFDYYLGMAHGTPQSVLLGENSEEEAHLGVLDFEIYDLTHKGGLSVYFNDGARGVQKSCSVADVTKSNQNFAQVLANSANIPIEGLAYSGSAGLTKDLHLSSKGWGKIQGFNPLTGIGYYDVGKDKLIFENFETNLYWKDIPSNFDPSKIYHLGLSSAVSEIKPQSFDKNS